MPSPNLANLRKQLANAEQQMATAMFQAYMNPATRRGFGPYGGNPYELAYTRLFQTVIPNLKRRIARREMANQARQAARRSRENRLARTVASKWRARTMRPPSPRKYSNKGGKTYQRIAKKAASPTLKRLMNQLNNLRKLNKIGNRGEMVNLYELMSKKWNRASNYKAAANIMNNAQRIMYKARLLGI